LEKIVHFVGRILEDALVVGTKWGGVSGFVVDRGVDWLLGIAVESRFELEHLVFNGVKRCFALVDDRSRRD
jgi:hypothetical protein